MSPNLKAIETVYKGYRFRSRLEARWAVFFDALGIKWEYEPEGFDLGAYGWYLPDFWLPKLGIWVEVKPEWPKADECNKAEALYVASEKDVVFLVGTPAAELYIGISGDAYGFHTLQDRLIRTKAMFPRQGSFVFWDKHTQARFREWVAACSPTFAIDAARSARFEHRARDALLGGLHES